MVMHINWLLIGIVAAFTLTVNFVKGWREAGQRVPLERKSELVGRSLAGADADPRQKGPWE